MSKPKPRLLDLFCGPGGAGVGYARAGFDVTGVDLYPQRHYPLRFMQGDAMTIPLDGYAVIHASPPCQGYSSIRNFNPQNAKRYPRMIEGIRERLKASGAVYVIENVVGAPLENPILLCGSMFRLWTLRHRLFECSLPLKAPKCDHRGTVKGGYYLSIVGNGGPRISHGGSTLLADWKAAMDIDWKVNKWEITEMIPPAYTEFIGKGIRKSCGW